MTATRVRKRDGRVTAFRVRKLVDSIGIAAAAAGEPEAVFAAEIAEVVVMSLAQRNAMTLPSTDEVAEQVEAVLLATNHPRTAEVYAERRRVRRQRRAEIVVICAPEAQADSGEYAAEACEPWNEGAIVKALVSRCQLEQAVAEEVAAAVEQRVFQLSVDRLQTSLVRELVNNELAARGYHARIRKPGTISLRSDVVQRALVASYVAANVGAPGVGGVAKQAPEAAIGGLVLSEWALRHVYPPAVAAAHRDGVLQVVDVGFPLRATSGVLSLEFLKQTYAPRSAADLMSALASQVAASRPFHARALGVPYANVFLAPFVRGRESSARRDLREAVRMLLASQGTLPKLVLHVGPLPPELATKGVIGRRGRKWRATYSELTTECERAAVWLREMLSQASDQLPFAAHVELVDGYQDDVGSPACRRHPLHNGLIPPVRVALGADSVPLIGGALGMVAVNCARAGMLAGPGNVPALSEKLHAAIGLACEGVAAKHSYLASTLFCSHLPLWQRQGSPPVVYSMAAAEAGSYVIALVGLSEALQVVAGESPAENPAVAELARSIAAEALAVIDQQGQRLGIDLRLEEPALPAVGQRLAELDAQVYPKAFGRFRAEDEFARCCYASSVLWPGVLGCEPVFGEKLPAPLASEPEACSAV